MTREEYLRRWSQLHGTDARAQPLVYGWLLLAHALAGPLVRAGVGAAAVTTAGLVVALAGVAPAWAGGRWAIALPLVVVVAGVADSLDGAVAVMTGTTSAAGAVLDAVCDRVADAAVGATLWLFGAPGGVVVLAVATGWLHEYLRARAQAAGCTGPLVISVSERPTRLAVPAAFALGVGVYPAAGEQWATVGAVVAAVVGLVGLGQLAVAARRRLREVPGR